MSKRKNKSDIDKLKLKETWIELKKTVGRIEQNIETLDDIDEVNKKKRNSTGNNMKENIEKGKALASHLRDIIKKSRKENKDNNDVS
jgi:hypothetical protein